MTDSVQEFDYIVVGSGAGGGPLASNLAEAGYRVLLLEAGGEVADLTHDVPVFHGYASESPESSWAYFVRHYQRTETQERDWKFTPERDGVFYPRAATLGGCTAHNAMITFVPHNGDWDDIAALTGDESWRSDLMQRYFERLERCTYITGGSWLVRAWTWVRVALLRLAGSRPPVNPGQHGLNGWLTTSMPDITPGIYDDGLMRLSVHAAEQARAEGLDASTSFGRLIGRFDPNDAQRNARGSEGVVFTPLATANGRRTGPKDRVRSVMRSHPDRLTLRLHALVTKVVIDESGRATGVEYLDGAHLYRADPAVTDASAPRRTVRAMREVILAAGAFNTPQILKLSGIGPRAELERHGIPVRADVPGVGENLQDRYEVGVVCEMTTNFSALETATFRPPKPDAEMEPALRDWTRGIGMYTTNGALCGVIKRSAPAKRDPDLFIFGLPGDFRGYHPGYSTRLLKNRNYFTWAILKAHTENRAGQVLLRSADPRDTPDIQFHYFGEGSGRREDDLVAVVDGIKFARAIMTRAGNHVRNEVVPGGDKQTDEELGQFVKDNAWGHHASCSARIGREDDAMAVLDSRFRVRGVKGLRVVDASVFPRIPGFFIVTAVYMISEKASDVILQDAGAVPHSGATPDR